MSNRLVLIIIFIILFVIPVFSGITLFASNISSVDSTQVFVRHPDQDFVEAYKSQKEFIYTQPPIKTNFIDQIWGFLIRKFKSWSVLVDAMPWIIKVLVWGCALFLFFFLIVKLKLYKIFYSEKDIHSPEHNFLSTDDQIIDYDNVIRLHAQQKMFRLAIRFLYLQLIHTLRSKEYIRYSKEKTNFDYLHDLSNEEIRYRFLTITSIYNHVWYGDVEIAEDQYLRFENSFKSFYKVIDVQE